MNPDRASELRALSGTRRGAAGRLRRLDTLAWCVLALAILLSLWLGHVAWQQARDNAKAQFDARAAAAATAIATRMHAYEDTVRAAAGVLEARPQIDNATFHAFVDKLQIPSHQASVHGLGFARLVAGPERDDYLAVQRANHGESFDIHPAGEREQYVVIDLLYPDLPGMRKLLGRDLLAEPARRAAVEQARDSGELAAAPRVVLADAAPGSPEAYGFLLYAPVYSVPLTPQSSIGQKQASLSGFAVAGFGWKQVVEQALGEGYPQYFDLQLGSGLSGEPAVFQSRALRQRHGAAMQPAFTHAAQLTFFGRSWPLLLESPPIGEAVPGIRSILLLVAGGIALGILLFILLRNLARADRRSRALLDAVADHLPALIAYIDRSGMYGFANRATRDWFGSATNWSGRTLEDVHADTPSFREALQRAMAECTPEHLAAWQAEVGNPARSVQVYLVPDVEKNQQISGWYLMASDNSEQHRANRELALARDHLQRITDKLPALIAQYDREERAVFFNRACADTVSWQQPYRPGIAISELFGEEAYARRKPYIDAVLSGHDVDFETSFMGPEGLRRMHTYYTPDIDETGRVNGFFVMSIDVTEKVRLETALYNANERAEVTLTSISEAVITADVSQRVTYMNPAAEALSGWPLERALYHPLDEVVPLSQVVDLSQQDGPHPSAMMGDTELRRLDGRRILVERSLSPLHDRDEAVIGSVLVLRDITEARALSSRMVYLAHHDSLTGLPNRMQLNETLAQLISSATNRGNGVAVLFIDLDLFKHVNDALGHHIGDQLLQQVARRIQRNIGNLGSVYRTGGDEFVVLLDNVLTRESVLQMADRLLAIGGTPYTVASHELHQAFSIGISLFPDDGYDAATLMMRADASMYLAKRSGRNAARFYTRELAASVDARIELENSLRRGLRNGDLCLHYQPQVDRQSGKIVGIEGLARWQRGDQLVLPGEFLPIAEETNLIVDIDHWAIHAACRQNRIWQQSGLPPVRVSVNIAAANFDTDLLLDTVIAALEDSGLAPEFLELEVTETTIMRDVQRTDRILRALKSLGVRIAIDDFGTGFSSLSYLGNYGFNVLKIDQSFVRDVAEPNQGAITRAIIGLASQLQCRTIAEGVETEEQAAWLASNGCDEMQGNLFSPPLPAAECAKLLARNTVWTIPRQQRTLTVHWS
ncbi:bifunctional diguanylate cyclase/phosphodiesterase [Pseudoxanthomonas wuyuanensis]